MCEVSSAMSSGNGDEDFPTYAAVDMSKKKAKKRKATKPTVPAEAADPMQQMYAVVDTTKKKSADLSDKRSSTEKASSSKKPETPPPFTNIYCDSSSVFTKAPEKTTGSSFQSRLKMVTFFILGGLLAFFLLVTFIISIVAVA